MLVPEHENGSSTMVVQLIFPHGERLGLRCVFNSPPPPPPLSLYTVYMFLINLLLVTVQILGLFDWSGCNPMPPEFWILPSLVPVHPGLLASL